VSFIKKICFESTGEESAAGQAEPPTKGLDHRERETVSDPPSNANPTAKLEENEDYYWEGSAMVFTASFLRRRGYCCESGCRHCPYFATHL
jgi:hypothetical protein